MSPHKKKTIYQILVSFGIVKSRQEALSLLKKEKVVINNKVITHLHYQSDPKREDILVNGKKLKSEAKKRYFILNKQKGVITTKENMLRTLRENVNINEDEINSYSPVGRLDKNTTGIIIITNDGDFAFKVLHPEKYVEKKYEALVEGNLSDEEINMLRSGVEIELEENGVITKYKTLPAKVKIIDDEKDLEKNKISDESKTTNNNANKRTKLEIAITEGKKRQIRRMFKSLNHNVFDLRRVNIGNLDLRKLNLGKIREISKEEMYKFVLGV